MLSKLVRPWRRHIVAMEMLWSVYIPVVLFSLQPVHSHRNLQGLSCLNDFVSNVSCTWNSSPVGPGVDCWIIGVKKIWKKSVKHVSLMTRSCKVKQQGDSPPGCSFSFEQTRFGCSDVMPSIQMECNGMLVGNLTNHKPCNHIKMHPPSVLNISTNASETWISWTPGSPVSIYFLSFEFHVQIKQYQQKWKEASNLFMQEQAIRIPSSKVRGHCQLRVRVRPPENIYPNTHWSNWSPTRSWIGAADTIPASEDGVWPLHRTSWLMLGGMPLLALIAVLVTLLRVCSSRRLFKRKPVPNPSKYFHTLHSVHGGNLKKWLNPQSASESFFTAQTSDYISPVKVSDTWDPDPSASPSSSSTSTSALLHSHPGWPSAGSHASGLVYPSSSSSYFSNMGYFNSSCSNSSAPSHPSPAYFTYQDDLKLPPNSRDLHLRLATSTSSTYECLKKEPWSPDSGFGIQNEDEEEKEVERDVDAEREETCSDNHDLEEAVAASGSYAACPVADAMCRSSSMPVESCKTGYLSLKELQTTFSNKSI
ncbi:hypothetical protein LDENG_00111400 [Lucifuga dentata]|nr:hypothetical protein LDENG_00111400 [Lucifuga dentata]